MEVEYNGALCILSFILSDIMLVAWNFPWWEYVCNVNEQRLQISPCPKNCLLTICQHTTEYDYDILVLFFKAPHHLEIHTEIRQIRYDI